MPLLPSAESLHINLLSCFCTFEFDLSKLISNSVRETGQASLTLMLMRIYSFQSNSIFKCFFPQGIPLVNYGAVFFWITIVVNDYIH